jgi:hypothetical protein
VTGPTVWVSPPPTGPGKLSIIVKSTLIDQTQ